MSASAGSNGGGDFSSQQSNGGPPPGTIPDALLERMMDRKLRMLDLEYEECLKATKSRNIEDYDSGPTGDDWDKELVDPEIARARGYAAFASVWRVIVSIVVFVEFRC